MNTEFKNLDDLYNRIKPALYSKVMELKERPYILCKRK